jgi:hypothetical protein
MVTRYFLLGPQWRAAGFSRPSDFPGDKEE